MSEVIQNSIYTCSGCGSKSTITNGIETKCEYCGNPILIKSQSVSTTSAIPPQQYYQPQQMPQQHVMYVNMQQTDGAIYQNQSRKLNTKKRGVAILLCLLLGFFGAHMFYVGRIGMGILYLFTCGLFFFGVIIDFLLILFGGFKDKSGNKLKEW